MAEQPAYIFSDFRLDPERRQLMRDGKAVNLHPKSLDLLLKLVENRGRLLTKRELLDSVWDGQFVEEGNLAVQISALRKAFGETKGDRRFIVTIPGRGYRFISPVEYENQNGNSAVHSSLNGNGFKKIDEKLPDPEVSSDRPLHRSYILWAFVGLILISGSTAMVLWRGAGPSETAVQLPAKQPGASIVRTSSVKKVTSTGRVRTAALSPDGKMFLYSSGDRGETGLWLGHADGGKHIELRPPASAKYRGLGFAPDGEHVYFVVAEESEPVGALYRTSILGGVPVKLRTIVNTQIAIAPDGKQFAYVRSDPETNRSSLIVAELEGPDEKELASRPSERPFLWETPSWSPDGEVISAAAASEPDSVEIVAVNVKDGAARLLTSGSNWTAVRAIEWLKDGRGLLVIASDKDAYGVSQLYQVSYPDGAVQIVNPDLISYSSSLKLSSDNRTLLTNQVQRHSNIWVAPVEDLARSQQVTFGSLGRLDGWRDVIWTPDRKLLNSAMVGNKLTIWKTEPDGAGQLQLSVSNANSHEVSTTRDGRYLVFESDQSGTPEIWRANGDGQDPRQLTSTGQNTRPHVSPDGGWIAFMKRDGFIWRMAIDGSEETRWSRQQAALPRFSPDGRYIACIYQEPEGRTQVAVLTSGDGAPVNKFDVPQTANFSLGLRWTPDGRSITYRDWFHGIWRQDIAGGPPRRLPGLPTKLQIYGYDWSPDGGQLAYALGQNIADVVLVTIESNSTH